MTAGVWGCLLAMGDRFKHQIPSQYPTQWEQVDALSCRDEILTCRERLQLLGISPNPLPGNQWDQLSQLGAPKLLLQKKNWLQAHIQNKKVKCHISCIAAEKGHWPLLFCWRARTIKKYLPQNLEGTSDSSLCISCQSYKVNIKCSLITGNVRVSWQ